MKRDIKQLMADEHLHEFAKICTNAYPGFNNTPDKWKDFLDAVNEKDPVSTIWGIWENRLVGGMRLLDFKMNYNGNFIDTGGVGCVAVDLVSKKRGLAKDLLSFFLDECERKQQYLAMLYPFRPDFYFKMGFGYGPKMYRYCFTPQSLPTCDSREVIAFLTKTDLPHVKECYNTYAQNQHGFCTKTEIELDSMSEHLMKAQRVVGYWGNGKLRSYLSFSVKRVQDTNALKNHLLVKEWIWLDKEAFLQMCSFLRSQADQFDRIVFNTQINDFHFLLKDIRNETDNIIPSVYHESHKVGVGLMYRIELLEEFLNTIASFRNFNRVTLDLELYVEDSFRPQNEGCYQLSFNDGQLSFNSCSSATVKIHININHLSSLLMGSVRFETLYKLGCIKTNATDISVLQQLFRMSQEPQCLTAF